MNRPLLSIIIPNWNTAEVTANCVSSIIKNLSSLNLEIIVVDNGSTDDSVAKLSNFSKKFSKFFHLIVNPANLGFAKANNIGVKHSKGDYLLFLNSDMILPNNSISQMFDYLLQHKEIGAIGPKFLNPDMSPQASVFPPQTVTNAIKEYWFGQENTYSKYIPPTDSPTSVWSISGGCILISRQVFSQIGGWNEKYHFYYEDLDLCRSIHRLHQKIYYFPSASVVHFHGVSGKNITDSSNQWRRLIASSKIYFGTPTHYCIFLIIWLGQKLAKLTVRK